MSIHEIVGENHTHVPESRSMLGDVDLDGKKKEGEYWIIRKGSILLFFYDTDVVS